MKELECALKMNRNRKAAGIDNMNIELLKYGGPALISRNCCTSLNYAGTIVKYQKNGRWLL